MIEASNRYNITTYNASRLIERYQIESDDNPFIYYYVDYNSEISRRFYIASTNAHGDCALLYQLRNTVDDLCGQQNWDKDALNKYIIYVDFQNEFRNISKETPKEEKTTYTRKELDCYEGNVTTDFKLKSMFNHGIHIQYGDEIVHYIPFDKSNSMSRESKMSFVNRDIVETLNERLNLGIDFSQINVNLNKYYSYRGLYLTDGERIDIPMEKLNSDTVIVCSDMEAFVKNVDIITNSKDEKIKLSQEHYERFFIKEPFDGEGLVSMEYAEMINEGASFNGATSFQIRLPFAKGMLHSIDFHGLAKELLDDENVKAIYVEDIFGVERDLLKAEIVLSASMFKCAKWLEDYWENTLQAKGYDKTELMDFYFQQLYEYDHGLYVAKTNLPYGRGVLSKLNYQFLNTLDIPNEQFDELVNEHLKWVFDPIGYLKMYEGTEKYGTSTEDSDDVEMPFDHIWKEALYKNCVFAHEPYIDGQLKGISKKLREDCARGRLLVNGEERILSRDLIKFVLDLLKPNYFSGNINQQALYLNIVHINCLKRGRFYMPHSRIEINKSLHYPILRSPHLSRNEQVALKPYIAYADSLIYKYLSHLKGVIFVAYNSVAPIALGGADFDGDTVKIFDDKRIRDAVIKGTMENYRRTLPITNIEALSEAGDERVPENIDYNTIKNTFNSRIGLISDLSIKIAEIEYRQEQKSDYTCAECTILTGLEIDSAKSGKKPYLDDILNFDDGIEENYCDYKGFLYNLNELHNKHEFLTSKLFKKKDNTYSFTGKYKKKYTYEFDENYHGIDRLPKQYMDSYSEIYKAPECTKVKNKYIYFDFLINDSWKTNINEEIFNQVKNVVEEYQKVRDYMTDMESYYNNLNNASAEPYYKKILSLQYPRERLGKIYDELIREIYNVFERLYPKVEDIDELLDYLDLNYWPYASVVYRSRFIRRITRNQLSIAAIRLLIRFSNKGYTLIYYILSDIKVKYQRESPIVSYEARVGKQEGSDIYNQFYDVAIESYTTKKGWRTSLQNECMKMIDQLIDNLDDDERLYTLYLSRKYTTDNCLFWKYVTIQDINNHVNRGE